MNPMELDHVAQLERKKNIERINEITRILGAVETLSYLDRNLLYDLGGKVCSKMVQEYIAELQRRCEKL